MLEGCRALHGSLLRRASQSGIGNAFFLRRVDEQIKRLPKGGQLRRQTTSRVAALAESLIEPWKLAEVTCSRIVRERRHAAEPEADSSFRSNDTARCGSAEVERTIWLALRPTRPVVRAGWLSFVLGSVHRHFELGSEVRKRHSVGSGGGALALDERRRMHAVRDTR